MYVYFDLLRVQAGGRGLSWEVLECISAFAQSLGYLCPFSQNCNEENCCQKREGLPVGGKDYLFVCLFVCHFIDQMYYYCF